MTTIVKYNAVRTADGLLVKDVIMAVTGKPSGKPELTTEMFDGFVSNFTKRLDRGSIGAYVLLDHDGPRVGRIVSLTHVGDELLGDLLITEESIANRVEEADLSDISISFFPGDMILVDVSLLDNAFGALSDEIPPFLVDVQQEFGLSADTKVEYKYQAVIVPSDKGTSDKAGSTKQNSKDIIMDLTPEQLQKMIEDAVAKATTPAPVADPVNEKAIAEALAKLAKKDLDITVDGYVRNLVRGGYALAGLKESFEKFGTNTMAMEVEYKRLMEKSTDEVKLEMEAEYEAPKLDDELKTGWEDYKEMYKSDMSFATFCELAKGEGRADLSKHKEAAIVVEGSVQL